jgi:hypothetical protein
VIKVAVQRTATRMGPEYDAESFGPFAKAAEPLWHAGLAPIPVGGEDGKKPLVTHFTKWKRRPPIDTIRKWIDRFADANVGVVTGSLSGVTVVDIDSAELSVQDTITKRFGDSPLRTRTPSGGCHLWFRHNGEASADLTPHMPVQIKAAGGFVVVPPSVRPSGLHAGRSYEFIQGTLTDLAGLPCLRKEGIDRVDVAADNTKRLRAVKEGRRNNSLFRYLKDHAPHCDDYETLLDVGMTFGQHDCDPPLPSAEIIKTVNSIWKMREEERLWSKGAESRVVVPKTVVDTLSSDALKLYLKLQFSHFDRDQFALSPRAMAKAQVISGWSHQRYRAARDELLEKGHLKMFHEGGSRPRDPSLFGFASPPVAMDTKSVPNITKHPPPL